MMLIPLILLAIVSLGVGILYSSRPEVAIEWQRRAYEACNWRLEPISLEKELRNMKNMGKFLVLLSMATIVYIIVNK
ncbi:MAG: hypothetical protein JSW17_00405 [Candidatus Omnitrophota bacterium]|nr:MAG: hypothetical protein JSW17_00405 [Candidatus Omnitrophota bacterium]